MAASAAWLVGSGGSETRSIAALPIDIGSDTAHAYLAAGLSGELTSLLSKILGVDVRAYSSSKAMRGRSAREAGAARRVLRVVFERGAVGGRTRFCVPRCSLHSHNTDRSIDASDGLPHSFMASSNSVRRISITRATPSAPPTERP